MKNLTFKNLNQRKNLPLLFFLLMNMIKNNKSFLTKIKKIY